MAISQDTARVLSELQNLDFSRANKADIYALLAQLEPWGEMEVTIPQGTVIVRTRCEVDYADVYYEKDISCRTNPSDVGYGRANSVGVPAFYGVISLEHDYKTAHSRSVCVAEVAKVANDPAIVEGMEYAYTGFWIVEREITGVGFINHSKFKQQHALLAKLQSDHNAFLDQNENGDDLKAIFDFFAEEFAKDVPRNQPELYKITSALADDYLGHNTAEGVTQYPAIIFPSVKAEGNGINIAMTPDAVKKHLKLKSVFVEQLFKDRVHVGSRQYLKCHEFQPDGKFIWKEDNGHSVAIVKRFLREQNEA